MTQYGQMLAVHESCQDFVNNTQIQNRGNELQILFLQPPRCRQEYVCIHRCLKCASVVRKVFDIHNTSENNEYCGNAFFSLQNSVVTRLQNALQSRRENNHCRAGEPATKGNTAMQLPNFANAVHFHKSKICCYCSARHSLYMDTCADYRNITRSKITALSMKKCSGNSETVEKKYKNKVKLLFSLVIDR